VNFKLNHLGKMLSNIIGKILLSGAERVAGETYKILKQTNKHYAYSRKPKAKQLRFKKRLRIK